MLDASLARTRLLILQSEILSTVKSRRSAPKNLGAFPTALTTDPYSGRPFVYRASGPDFALYSVGADFRDNGGETDESFTAPDVTLER